MYKSNSNFGVGCPNWAGWADIRFGFVHFTNIIEQNKSVCHSQDTSTNIWCIGIENLFLKRHLMSMHSLGKKVQTDRAKPPEVAGSFYATVFMVPSICLSIDICK